MGVKTIGKLAKGAVLVDYNGTLHTVDTKSGLILKAKLQDVNAYLRPGVFVQSDPKENRRAEKLLVEHFTDTIEEK